MPEGDSVHKIAALLAPDLQGRVVDELTLRDRGVVRELSGGYVDAVEVAGKHLLVRFRAGIALRIHLGMKGRWGRYRRGARWDRTPSSAVVVIRTRSVELVCFRAAQAELLRLRPGALPPGMARLGPDLLGDEPEWGALVARARARSPTGRAIGEVLLDQSIAAGIGNVYRSEVLFLGGVHPKAPLASLSDRTVERLFRRARALMQANLGPGRRVTVPRRGPGAPRLWVYKRRHRPCLRCGSTIERLALGDEARAVYFCPSCQPLASRSVLAPRTEGRRSSSRDATAGDGRVSSPTGAATAAGPGADGRADREP